MPVITQGGVNPAATGVPDLYVNVNPPPAAALPGAPSYTVAVVGTGTWGPVNSPTPFGDPKQGAAIFGQPQVRKYDLMTQAAVTALQGVNSFVGVRVTDGTDVAASAIIQTNCLTLTAKYTGTTGNSLNAAIANGTANGSFKITISLPNQAPEVFDNITGSGNAFWVNAAAAINNGQNAVRGASQLVTATAGAGVTAPAVGTTTFSGGIDGATTITSTVMIGSDSASPRTGMYALRSSGASHLVMADLDTSTTWPTQIAFAKSEQMFAWMVSPAGDTLSNFGTTMNSAGVDDAWGKVLFGDWIYYVDGANNVTRLVSPQGYAAGKKAALGPHQSELNKALNGVAGTQSTANNRVYSESDLQTLVQARGDVICTPSVGGNYFSCRTGRSASSNPATNTSTYATMTNYLVKSFTQIGTGLGSFVGRLITPSEMREAKNAIGGFLQNEWLAGRIGTPQSEAGQGPVPYSVQIDVNNNPLSQTQLGIQKATVMVTYQSVLQYFLLDLTGGSTVVVPGQTVPRAA